MTGFLKTMVFVLLGAVAIHYLAIWGLPRAIMAVGAIAADRSDQLRVNHIIHPPKVTKDARTVVRPAPDLAYSACPFDMRKGGVRVVLPASDDYSSVSFFASNTDNFFALNDRAVEGDAQEIWLLPEDDQATQVPPHIIRVDAQSDRGLILFRRVIPSEADWPRIDAERRRANCEPL